MESSKRPRTRRSWVSNRPRSGTPATWIAWNASTNPSFSPTRGREPLHDLDWEDDLKSPERSAGLDADGLEYWDTEPEPEPQEDRSRGPEPEPVQETTLDPEEKEKDMDLEM